MNYFYPSVGDGYRWNLLKRCLYEVGIEPSGCGDVGDQTVLTFSRPLTETEKLNLDKLMADSPTNPPESEGTVFRISDIGEKLELFNEQTGIEFRLYCSGDGKTDVLELHSPYNLTSDEISKVKKAYSNLLR